MTDSRVFASSDAGITWRERPAPTGCTPRTTAADLQVRSDGVVFVNCNGRNLRSDDDGGTWTLIGPYRFIVDEPLVFDPRDPRRAAVRRASYDLPVVVFTDDDARTFTATTPATGAVVPSSIAWDPLQADRLIGIGIEEFRTATGTDVITAFYRSADHGAHWTRVTTIVPTWSARSCHPRRFQVDLAGRLYLRADCGMFRSQDNGATWQKFGDPSNFAFASIAFDPTNTAHSFIMDANNGISESRDAGATWQPVVAPPGYPMDIVVNASGELYAATLQGIVLYNAAQQVWEARNRGINTRAMQVVEPGAGLVTTLTAFGILESEVGVQSTDGGQTWHALTFALGRPIAIRRNVTVPSSVFAVMDSGAIYSSADGGVTWAVVNTQSQPTGLAERIAYVTPVGPQPGLVYGYYRTCEGTYGNCLQTNHGVTRSLDGGRSWTHIDEVINGLSFSQLEVSPANTQVVMLSGSQGTWVSQNGGDSWETHPYVFSRLVPDPADAARWYAVGAGNAVFTTTTMGLTWAPIAPVPMVSSVFDLLVDPRDAQRIYAVGNRGDIGLSRDRGSSWQIVVAPSSTLTLVPYSARIGPESITTIYAAGEQGVVKYVIATANSTTLAKAIEFHRADVDHYFVSADPAEIARLDSGSLAGWLRTGHSFNVFVDWKDVDTVLAPVCRFYGRPEAGLDSHFYSASPVECQAVRDRFSAAWIDESAAIFGVQLPSVVEGLCPNRTTPVYRLYNNRPDANHRYTMWPELRERMVASGWLPEGYGPSGVAMCAPW